MTNDTPPSDRGTTTPATPPPALNGIITGPDGPVGQMLAEQLNRHYPGRYEYRPQASEQGTWVRTRGEATPDHVCARPDLERALPGALWVCASCGVAWRVVSLGGGQGLTWLRATWLQRLLWVSRQPR